MMFPTDKITVAYKPKITSITLNHEDWQLYPNAPGVDSLAGSLNEALQKCVYMHSERQVTRQFMLKFMSRPIFVAAGATDSEPMDVLDDLLDKIYGRAT
jgi:hypothetical protein